MGLSSGSSENSFTVSYKSRRMLLPYESAIPTLKYLSKWNLSLGSHKNLNLDVYTPFWDNYQQLETTQMSFNCGMNKLWYINIVKYYLAKKGTNSWHTEQRAWNAHAQCKLKVARFKRLHKKIFKKATYCMNPFIWHSRKCKTMETKKPINSCHGLELKRRIEHRVMWDNF